MTRAPSFKMRIEQKNTLRRMSGRGEGDCLLTRDDTRLCGCLVTLVARTRQSATYDGLTLVQHSARTGVPVSTLDKRVRKFGHPFPARLTANAELCVFEQDRENNRRTRDTRLGRAAAHHRPHKAAA